MANIHQTAGSVPAPRESHPHMVLMRPPPLPATASRPKIAVTLGLWLDGSIIVPITGHCPTGSCPVVIAGWYRSLAAKQTEVEEMCPFVVHHRQIMAQPLKWLMLITRVMGKYLMDWYSVVKVQTRFTNRNRWRFSVSPPVS